MRHYLMLVTTLLVVIFFPACNRSTVNLQSTNAKDEVEALQNLVFRFDRSLVPDSLLNQWDSTDYISFSPAIAGRFRWEQPDELVFSPAGPLPPATDFTANINKNILQFSEFNSVNSSDKINFHTAQLKLEESAVVWINNGGSPTPQLELYFNHRVKPEDVKGKLSIQLEDNDQPYTLQTVSADSKLTLVLNTGQVVDRDLNGSVKIAKGIIPVGGKNGTPEDQSKNFMVPSPYNLTINDIQPEHDGISGRVIIKTSQAIRPENISSFVEVEPSLKFSSEQTDEGLVVSSDQFDANQAYTVKLKKGLRGVIGGVLREDYAGQVSFGELQPSISFSNSRAVYLASAGNEFIEMKIVNVPKVKVIISKIYESNILLANRYGFYPKDDSREMDEEYYYAEYETNDLVLGDIVYEAEIDTRSLPKLGNSRLFKFNVEDRLADFKGIYHIKVRSTDDYWINESRFISKTDIGLIAREGKDRMVVFANSIKTASPLNGINLILYGNNNQVLGTGVTNGDGVAEVVYARREFAGFRPAMVIAKTEGDFNYLPLQTTAVNTSRFDVGGKKLNSTGLDAFVYEERDIYRPGETIHFSVIVRDNNWNTPGELPVNFRFLFPNGKEMKAFRKNLNAQGATEGAIALPEATITGTYTLEVFSSNNVLLTTRSYNVEEFMPDRIKVKTTLDKPFLQPGISTNLSINAVNFFGPPAANRKYEAEIQVKPKSFNPKKYNRYQFSINNEGLTFDKVVREGTTDASGNATELYEVPAFFANSGILQASFYATVFDETGRPVSRKTNADIYTQPVFFGIGDDGYYYYPLNQQVRFPLIALNRSEQPAAARAEVKVIKHEYRTVLAKVGRYFRYDSQKEDKILTTQTIPVTGENSNFSFVPRSPGEYEVRVSMPGASSYVSKSFYSYGSWGASASSFEVDTEGSIDIELDKTSYLLNEKANVLFKTPFSGRMLVTVERDQVISHRYVDVQNRSASMELDIAREHIPNVYITATLIRPHAVSDIPLTVAHGFQRLNVEDSKRKLPLTITAAKNVRSKTRQKVTVKTEPNSFVTLAAVDDGVLQITDYKTPDAYSHFYASRALDVSSYDLYPLLFPEISARLSSTGGDGDLEMEKRVNPMPSKRVKLLSYWSGIRQANANGEVVFDIDIPSFSGAVRYMAVSYRDNCFGNGEMTATVADPLVLSTAAPRFMSPGDTVALPVTVSNTTANPQRVTATLVSTGPLKPVGATTQTVEVNGNSEASIPFAVSGNTLGVGRLKVSVTAGSEKNEEEIELGIRPASPLQVITGSGSITGNQQQQLRIPVEGFLKGTVDYRLVIGRTPTLDLAKPLSYLLQYPYGCTEQVISAAFPLLYYDDLSKIVRKSAAASNANAYVQDAIAAIRLRQLYNGAVTLWEGEGTEHWWASVYAAHFLIEAKKAGFDVENRLLSGLLSYINSRLRNKETILYYYNRDQQKKIAPKEVAYSLYVLSLASQANVPVMNYYKANPALLSLDSKYMLAVSYAIAGDKARFREVLPSSFAGEVSNSQTGGSFYSDLRDEAIALNSLLDADPANAQVPVMAKHVADKLRQRSWFNTQEAVFSFLSLGKIARAAAASTAKAEIIVNGKRIATVAESPVKLTAAELGSANIEIKTSGQGKMYYYWEAEGINESGAYKEEDSYLSVRRRFFDRYGKVISGNEFKRNDLVIVQLTVQKTYAGTVENVVISDLLPAGFEVENPRTKEIPGMDWIKDAATPVSLDVRDDRVNLFDNLSSQKQTYYYAVRAVSTGSFKLAPAAAEAMYNAEYHSYNGGGIIRIRE